MEFKMIEEDKSSSLKEDSGLVTKLKEASKKTPKPFFTTKRQEPCEAHAFIDHGEQFLHGPSTSAFLCGKLYDSSTVAPQLINQKFLSDFQSLIWISYRNNFTGITAINKHYKSDSGWGCMIRAAQMLLANCLIRHNFANAEYSIKRVTEDEPARLKFMDNLKGPNAGFSIGNIVETGLEYDRKPGDWYGPSTMIQIFEQLNERYKPYPELQVVAFPEGVIYINKMEKKMEGSFCPIIVFIGFRLGLEKINSEYFPGILRLMSLKSFVGISGGQGNGALYFVGYQNKELIFLDPHVTQPAVTKVEDLWVEHLSYHYPSPMRLPLSKLNTSLAFGTTFLNTKTKGFYLSTKEDYDKFIADMKKEMKEVNSFIQIYDKEFTYDIPEESGEEVIKIGDGDKDEVFILY